eukprot:CAMPEP_0204837178 /NCGR_PEP_ID=MMETSP1346-20131115/27274_1 /ASSEMBLY_ACC=CAM_ASM_000771 /TAXON_ID=215587 /ORGANISM="Aplanochytrium stocchinoi, Strain GSBS06" /LENGTH=38 /DNA_ID= /DNA_START= /DNA_END= /DNA_ORIENTATION=
MKKRRGKRNKDLPNFLDELYVDQNGLAEGTSGTGFTVY